MGKDDAPPIAALYLVVFDQKVGYTISWKRTLPDVSLDGVEYKCLPSGLHSVKQDLVYFVHGAYAGVSAFVQAESDEQHRNASFVAVGALVPLSFGRLGKGWLHAAELRLLAEDVVGSDEDKRGLERYWKEYQQDVGSEREPASPSMVRRASLPPEVSRKRKRARSDASDAFPSDHTMASDHPALSVPGLLNTFGPLVFPLYRALLLRRRVLLLGTAPVQRSCNFVYMLSILSSIPQSFIEVVQPDSDAPLRTQALFNVGIHDIPFLSEQKRKARWLACTTDDILSEKHQLYDVLVSLPPPPEAHKPRRWPTIHTSDGADVKATQRDLRRYRFLRAELDRLRSSHRRYRDNPANSTDDGEDTAQLLRAPTTDLLHEVKRSEPGEGQVVEPVSWSAMAYNSFMWWASAGEMDAWESEEAKGDRQLLEDLPEMEALLPRISGNDSEDYPTQDDTREASATATVVTAYFHRLTTQIIQPLADAVEDADDDTEEGLAEAAVPISSYDMNAMGLDAWSPADKRFVKDAMDLYFGREAVVADGGTRVCGVRIC
ncbi:hypothetical protein LTR37_014727 [Vermiconidia calcicola]|uniref:Uncharacterized protein n=1 Tax=Vermiconidia calcicola TaxID=1690605 RepID=A0ACC3MSW7_9PEZI|nr:hypothetical protein LTR37_014727 [Vermiconidia calcicola]